MKQVVFLEFIDEADAYIEEHHISKEDTLFIALTARLRCYLLKKGYNVESTFPYFDTSAHERVTLSIQEVVEKLKPVLSIEDSLGIKEVYANTGLFYIRLVLSHLYWIIEIIDAVYRIHTPIKVGGVVSSFKYGGGPLITLHEHYLGHLVRAYAEMRGIQFVSTELKSLSKKMEKNNKGIIKSFNNLISAISRALCIWSFKRVSRSQKIAVIFMGYRIETVVERLQTAFPKVAWCAFIEGTLPTIRLVFTACASALMALFKWRSGFFRFLIPVNIVLPVQVLDQPAASPDQFFLQNAASVSKKVVNVLESLAHCTVPVGEMVVQKWRNDIFPDLKNIQRVTSGVYDLFKKAEPCLVMSPFSYRESFAVGEICRHLGIPGLLIPHGSFRVPTKRFDEIEFDHLGRGVINTEFPYVAAQSPWEVGYALHHKIKSKVVKTGPLIWSIASKTSADFKTKIVGLANKNKKLVLHAATQKARNNFRTYINETADEYIEEIKQLWAAIESYDEATLVVKFRPKVDLSVNDLRNSLPTSDRLIIITEAPLAELLAVTDLLVSFQSTVVQEAILSKIPVLLYGGRGRYVHFPGVEVVSGIPMVRSATYHVSDSKDLLYALRWLLDKHHGRCLNSTELEGHLFVPNEREDIVDFIRRLMKI